MFQLQNRYPETHLTIAYKTEMPSHNGGIPTSQINRYC